MKLRQSALACAAASIVLVFTATGRASISGINPALGDFNDDGWVNRLDIDLLAVRAFEWASNSPAQNILDPHYAQFDLNGSGDVTFAIGGDLNDHDSDVLIRDILETQYGDANLDGNADLSDLFTLATYWLQTGPLLGLANANFDGSQQIGMTPPRIHVGDLFALATFWRFTDVLGNVDPGDRGLDSFGNRGISVPHSPEPISLQVWALGALCAYCVNQRRAKRLA